MRIKDSMPGIFQKAYPVLDPKTEMLPAMSLLRFHEIDALPLAFDGGGKRQEHKQRAVFGFSSLVRLLLLKPKELGPFLKKPCETVSESLVTVGARQSLSSLLDAFARTRFGFARVEDGRNVGALAGLSDVLGLYETGAIASDLTVRDVGSPILSTPGETTLRGALKVMFEKRYRRIFVSGEREFVSDRGIIGHIFAPTVLNSILQDGKDVLDTPVSVVEKTSAKEVQPDTHLKKAAGILRAEKAGQCLVFDGMVVTPWDIVMKPWKTKALKLKTH